MKSIRQVSIWNVEKTLIRWAKYVAGKNDWLDANMQHYILCVRISIVLRATTSMPLNTTAIYSFVRLRCCFIMHVSNIERGKMLRG